MASEEGLTPISELGEFGLIEHLAKKFIIDPSRTVKGIGDDAAILNPSGDLQRVLSTDMLLEGIHFDLTFMPIEHLGYKAVVVNLSDIYAMNALPDAITVSVALSNRFTVEAMDAFYSGVLKACKRYGVDLVGGDTSSSTTGMVISVTASGLVPAEKAVTRDGAKVNDLVCVSGDLGAAYAGLQILQREKSVFLNNPDIQPDLESYEYVVGRNLKPEARNDIIETLAEAGIVPTSMIDVSDGMASELNHICRQSGVGVSIFEEKVPIHIQTSRVADEFNISNLTFAMNGGEDYELLFTANLEDFDKLNHLSNIHVIGHITNADEGMVIVGRSGNVIEITAQGWDHFRSE